MPVSPATGTRSWSRTSTPRRRPGVLQDRQRHARSRRERVPYFSPSRYILTSRRNTDAPFVASLLLFRVAFHLSGVTGDPSDAPGRVSFSGSQKWPEICRHGAPKRVVSAGSVTLVTFGEGEAGSEAGASDPRGEAAALGLARGAYRDDGAREGRAPEGRPMRHVRHGGAQLGRPRVPCPRCASQRRPHGVVLVPRTGPGTRLPYRLTLARRSAMPLCLVDVLFRRFEAFRRRHVEFLQPTSPFARLCAKPTEIFRLSVHVSILHGRPGRCAGAARRRRNLVPAFRGESGKGKGGVGHQVIYIHIAHSRSRQPEWPLI